MPLTLRDHAVERDRAQCAIGLELDQACLGAIRQQCPMCVESAATRAASVVKVQRTVAIDAERQRDKPASNLVDLGCLFALLAMCAEHAHGVRAGGRAV